MATTTPDMDTRPPPLDMSHHLSRVTKRRVASSMKKFYKYFSIPGVGQLAGGLPNANYFPYDDLEAQSATSDRFTPSPTSPTSQKSSFFARAKPAPPSTHTGRILIPHKSSGSNPLTDIDVSTALQYSTAAGYPALANFIQQFVTTNLHPNCPYQGGPGTIVSCGNTDGWSKVLEAFTNVWDQERDWLREREGVLCEEFSYPGAMQGLNPRGLNCVNVAMDEQGMLAEGKGGLADVLENWDTNRGKRPHIIYTVTVGQNPTGGIHSLERRKQIYAICQKYDILIVEDDPYWFLQYPSSLSHASETSSTDFPSDSAHNYNTESLRGKSSGYEFLDSLVPSYISLDTDGRVIRLDTFSKCIAPGSRLGWITAQPVLIERFMRITEMSSGPPSGFAQSMVAELLIGPGPGSPAMPGDKKRKASPTDATPGWSTKGWVQWLAGLRDCYEKRMLIMSTTMEEGKYLISDKQNPTNTTISQPQNTNSTHQTEKDYSIVSKTAMYKFTRPMGGMFLWLEMLFESHPLFSQISSPRLSHCFWIWLTLPSYKILISPGSGFAMSPTIAAEQGWRFFRICFAAVDDDMVKSLTERFVKGCHEFWDIDDIKVLEKLEKDDEESNSLEGMMERTNIAEIQYVINPMMY